MGIVRIIGMFILLTGFGARPRHRDEIALGKTTLIFTVSHAGD